MNNNNNVPQNSVAVSSSSSAPITQQDANFIKKRRTALRNRIYAIVKHKQQQHQIFLHKKNQQPTQHAILEKQDQKCIAATRMIEEELLKSSRSFDEYSDLTTFDARVQTMLQQLGTILSQRRAAAMNNIGGAQCITPTRAVHTSTSVSNNSFQSGRSLVPINCTTAAAGGFSIGPDMHTHHSTGANHQITCGISSPLITGFNGNCVPVSANIPMTSQDLFNATHFSTLPQPFLQPPPDQSHMHRYSMSNVASFGQSNPYPCGVVMSSSSMAVSQNSTPWNPNPMQGLDATVTSYHSNLQPMQQTPLPKRQLHHPLWNTNFQSAPNNRENLPQVSQQLLNHGSHQHRGQHSQNLYPGQLQNQDHLLPNLTQQAMALASLESYEEALQKHATKNGFKPSKLQCQQTAVQDHYIGAQSVSVHSSQMNSSPSLQPHPHQKQSESIPVQRQTSLQNSTEILQNNNGQREHTHMQPEPVHRVSSPIAPINSQTVSPRNTVERKRPRDGNDTSSKQVNEDCGQTSSNTVLRWIPFMFHARHCKAKKDKCASKFCFQARKIVQHIDCCKVPNCKYRYCLGTRMWLDHFKQCKSISCRTCVAVRDYMEKNKYTIVPLRRAKCSSASSKCQPKKSSKSRKAYKKGGAEAPSVDADLQRSIKRPKLQRPSQNITPETKSISVTGCGVVCKPHSLMNMQEKDGLQSLKVEAMPMDIDVPDASEIPVTRELVKHVAEDTPKGNNCGGFAMDEKTSCLLAQGKYKCMNEMSAPKEQNVKQCVDVVDASKMEISSLVELFTPEQVKEHIRSLRQWVGQSKTKADKYKAMGFSLSANSCQLCAVERLVFEPIPIYCSPCGVRIKKNAFYYSIAAGESRHYVCAPCYNEARENTVSVDGTSIPKARLEKKKNDEKIEEGWVQCDNCEAWQHQVCALFNNRRNHGEATKYTCPNCYIQEVEKGERRTSPPSVIPGAKNLPVTTLSNHIEERLFKKLKEERQERARLQGKTYEEVPGAESLTVRVVASVDKVLEVKERFLELFREENYPSEFTYKSKAILLFQKIENVEVCLFGMFVQEFGTDSGPPNERRVYLSYLDSVKYFRPEVRTVSGEALRTFVYHEILIGYLDYCKKRGFTSCYIWACPPLKGEDYILYCHPEIQKTPKTDKLREWYLAMLRKASKEDVVVECTNLYNHFFVQSGECRANVTAARLPYFDGDYWPGAAEDLIRQMNQEDDETKFNRKGLTKRVLSKRALKAVGQLDLSVNASKDQLLMQKLGETICPLKEDFIMVHLQHCCKHCSTLMVSGNRWVCNHCKNFQICDKCNELEHKRINIERHPINQKEKHALFPVAIKDVPCKIEDKDDNLESEFFDNRQAFLNLCQGNNYQYDTLRRAKHSSMMILYHLHNPTAPAFATFCTICQQEIENSQGWHCEVCPGYDVCSSCYSKASIDHSHNLISRSSSTDSTVVQENRQASQNYQVQLEKLKEVLVHVAACRSTLCQYQGCRKFKTFFRHCIACKIGPGSCPHCKRFWNLLRLHARSCRDSQCTVPKCRDFRAISCRQQQQSDKRRRAAVMEMMRERAAEATRTG
ncbi:Zinc finger FYVE/PHD-type [Arabidopsis suecica]|uniref:histone acetyltransferase n=1 Tax=Arabidopsis suecica TaxID=45249 RepID=A0A8T2CQU0_ARASU|nr:Zinc finger FYVE/PHD-type [Arabidopsis suecica]